MARSKHEQDKPLFRVRMGRFYFYFVIPAGEPIFEGRPGAHLPWANFLRWKGFDRFQFFAEFNFAIRLDVVGENDLVSEFKA